MAVLLIMLSSVALKACSKYQEGIYSCIDIYTIKVVFVNDVKVLSICVSGIYNSYTCYCKTVSKLLIL